ncbi:hypothetical protein NBRC110019_20570 [Neptunitalea chrysea]|uniref:Lipoprotein n=1 Tax=Neptunitalea chrysea TaxID=1647581 RepID=A0A9W6EVW2_9FLAO|nr:hypothetical protein [Neptunitalea chrysea]GLB53017.1 hypothetical protein NBRC110019_20570 [Neptunitalea chrysea]
MKKLIVLWVTALTVLSCTSTSEYELQVVTIANGYSLTIPEFLNPMPRLNREASLQYQNAFKEFYVIVIDESKMRLKNEFERNGIIDKLPDNLDEYTKLCLPSVQQSLKNYKKLSTIDTTINDMHAKLISFTGTIENIDIYYTIGYYESKDIYYQTLVWTTAQRKEEYKEQMNAILYTLTEVNK